MTYYPYTFRDADHLLAYTKSDVFKELAKGYEDKTGHHIVAVTYYGTRHTSSNKPIKSCADMQGLKMRVPDVPAYLAMPRACGANTAPIAFAEVYLALQNGTVEAQENPLTTIEAKKFYEVQKHIVPHRPHRRPPQHGDLEEPVGEALGGRTARSSPRSPRRPRRARDQADPEREKELVQFFKDKGLDGHRGRQGRVQGRRAEERAVRAVRLPQGRLGPHPGHQAGLLSPASRPQGGRQPADPPFGGPPPAGGPRLEPSRTTRMGEGT